MYDLIVIGAGSAGAVVAARASENPDLRVLLLEAGPDYARLDTTPDDLVNGHHNSVRDHDWGLRYVPTSGARPQPFPRGRVTGGSSAVNTTIALRGMPEDYDGWAAAGNPEWSFERCLPAFCRLERDLDFAAAPYHGDAGPISIRRYREDELTLSHQAFLETARELGYPSCPDANDPESSGAGPHPLNKLGRVRISTAVGYLAPARIRENLEIRAACLARRVLFEGRRAVGVEFVHRGETERVSAREVVCAAGAIHTPGLLVRSGVGDTAALEALGVDPVSDLPGLGANLCDHPAVSAVLVPHDPALTRSDLPLMQTILRYTAEGSDQRNDLQIELLTFVGEIDGRNGLGLAAVLEECETRGRLRVTDLDPRAEPAIEPALASAERDAARLAGCVFDVLAFTRTKPFSELIERVAFPDPGRPLDRGSAAELCRRVAGSGYHPCGTARMGPADDRGAVVDQYGRVHGVEGLRVADASIMPSVPRANTNLSCIMIGERIGEWLRSEGTA